MGAAGHAEYDYWADDDDVSVLTCDPEEEEAGLAEEEILQIATWIEEASSPINEHDVDEENNFNEEHQTLGKRRRSSSSSEEVTVAEMLGCYLMFLLAGGRLTATQIPVCIQLSIHTRARSLRPKQRVSVPWLSIFELVSSA